VYFRHIGRFHYIMQLAARLAQGVRIQGQDEHGNPIELTYTDERLLVDAGFDQGEGVQNTLRPNALRKFRNAKIDIPNLTETDITPPSKIPGTIKSREHAKKLWDYLLQRGFIQQVLSTHEIKKSAFYFEEEYSSMMCCFFDTHGSQIREFAKSGLIYTNDKFRESGEWFCYKNSFRKPGFVVKSKMSFTNHNDQYFEVTDTQHSSGLFEEGGHQYAEEASGFAFSKSRKLWCVLKEERYEQPRMFCFHHPDKPLIKEALTQHPGLTMQNPKLVVFQGYVLESDKLFDYGFHHSPVVIVSVEHERELFKQTYSKRKFDVETQIDIHPLDLKGYKPKEGFFIPPIVKRILNGAPNLADVKS